MLCPLMQHTDVSIEEVELVAENYSKLCIMSFSFFSKKRLRLLMIVQMNKYFTVITLSFKLSSPMNFGICFAEVQFTNSA